jgi:hypothetical protein
VRGFALLALFAAACSSGSTPSDSPIGSVTLSGALAGTFAQGAMLGCSVMTSPGPPQLSGEVNFGDLRFRFLGFAGSTTLPLGGQSLGLVDISNVSSSWSAGQDSPSSFGTLTLSRRTRGVIQGLIDATLTPDQGSTQTLHIKGSWSCQS